MSKFEVTNGDGKIAKTTSMREASGQGASGRFFSKKELEDMFPGELVLPSGRTSSRTKNSMMSVMATKTKTTYERLYRLIP